MSPGVTTFLHSHKDSRCFCCLVGSILNCQPRHPSSVPKVNVGSMFPSPLCVANRFFVLIYLCRTEDVNSTNPFIYPSVGACLVACYHSIRLQWSDTRQNGCHCGIAVGCRIALQCLCVQLPVFSQNVTP